MPVFTLVGDGKSPLDSLARYHSAEVQPVTAIHAQDRRIGALLVGETVK